MASWSWVLAEPFFSHDVCGGTSEVNRRSGSGGRILGQAMRVREGPQGAARRRQPRKLTPGVV
jgi:hypothetical protein